MKICCTVKVINRDLAVLNITNMIAKKSILTIAKQNKTEYVILHHYGGNMGGNTYIIKNNIKKVFVKCVNQGKATISFEKPNHDLAINCDPVQLRAFLKTLQTCLSGLPSAQVSSIPQVNVSKIKQVQTKLKIKSLEEYNGLNGYPRTLVTLDISNALVKRLDSRILRLQSLVTLNLEDNCLTTLPDVIGSSLANLCELRLKNNSLGESRDWRWIVNKNFQMKLKLLDLSSNKITFLPDKLGKLESLVTLKLNNNLLEKIPNSLANLKYLKYFEASNNKFCSLPFKMLSHMFMYIDVSGVLRITSNQDLTATDFQQDLSLLNITAMCIAEKRVSYSCEDIPRTLVDYMDNAPYCICGKRSFSMSPERYVRFPQRFPLSYDIVTSCGELPLSVKFCSFNCYLKNKKQMLSYLFQQ